MILHTDTLRASDVHAAAARFGMSADGIERGSRDYARSIDFKVNGSGRNGGGTWDEVGAVLGVLFDADPSARLGTRAFPIYDGRIDFAESTGGRYAYGMPEDAHYRHVWEYVGAGVQECRKCTATRYCAQAPGFGK